MCRCAQCERYPPTPQTLCCPSHKPLDDPFPMFVGGAKRAPRGRSEGTVRGRHQQQTYGRPRQRGVRAPPALAARCSGLPPNAVGFSLTAVGCPPPPPKPPLPATSVHDLPPGQRREGGAVLEEGGISFSSFFIHEDGPGPWVAGLCTTDGGSFSSDAGSPVTDSRSRPVSALFMPLAHWRHPWRRVNGRQVGFAH